MINGQVALGYLSHYCVWCSDTGFNGGISGGDDRLSDGKAGLSREINDMSKAMMTHSLWKIHLPFVDIRKKLSDFLSNLFPRRVVYLGRLLILVGLLIPFLMASNLLQVTFGTLFLALITAVTGSMACLVGCCGYVGEDSRWL